MPTVFSKKSTVTSADDNLDAHRERHTSISPEQFTLRRLINETLEALLITRANLKEYSGCHAPKIAAFLDTDKPAYDTDIAKILSALRTIATHLDGTDPEGAGMIRNVVALSIDGFAPNYTSNLKDLFRRWHYLSGIAPLRSSLYDQVESGRQRVPSLLEMVNQAQHFKLVQDDAPLWINPEIRNAAECLAAYHTRNNCPEYITRFRLLLGMCGIDTSLTGLETLELQVEGLGLAKEHKDVALSDTVAAAIAGNQPNVPFRSIRPIVSLCAEIIGAPEEVHEIEAAWERSQGSPNLQASYVAHQTSLLEQSGLKNSELCTVFNIPPFTEQANNFTDDLKGIPQRTQLRGILSIIAPSESEIQRLEGERVDAYVMRVLARNHALPLSLERTARLVYGLSAADVAQDTLKLGDAAGLDDEGDSGASLSAEQLDALGCKHAVQPYLFNYLKHHSLVNGTSVVRRACAHKRAGKMSNGAEGVASLSGIGAQTLYEVLKDKIVPAPIVVRRVFSSILTRNSTTTATDNGVQNAGNREGGRLAAAEGALPPDIDVTSRLDFAESLRERNRTPLVDTMDFILLTRRSSYKTALQDISDGEDKEVIRRVHYDAGKGRPVSPESISTALTGVLRVMGFTEQSPADRYVNHAIRAKGDIPRAIGNFVFELRRSDVTEDNSLANAILALVATDTRLVSPIPKTHTLTQATPETLFGYKKYIDLQRSGDYSGEAFAASRLFLRALEALPGVTRQDLAAARSVLDSFSIPYAKAPCPPLASEIVAQQLVPKRLFTPLEELQKRTHIDRRGQSIGQEDIYQSAHFTQTRDYIKGRLADPAFLHARLQAAKPLPKKAQEPTVNGPRFNQAALFRILNAAQESGEGLEYWIRELKIDPESVRAWQESRTETQRTSSGSELQDLTPPVWNPSDAQFNVFAGIREIGWAAELVSHATSQIVLPQYAADNIDTFETLSFGGRNPSSHVEDIGTFSTHDSAALTDTHVLDREREQLQESLSVLQSTIAAIETALSNEMRYDDSRPSSTDPIELIQRLHRTVPTVFDRAVALIRKLSSERALIHQAALIEKELNAQIEALTAQHERSSEMPLRRIEQGDTGTSATAKNRRITERDADDRDSLVAQIKDLQRQVRELTTFIESIDLDTASAQKARKKDDSPSRLTTPLIIHPSGAGRIVSLREGEGTVSLAERITNILKGDRLDSTSVLTLCGAARVHLGTAQQDREFELLELLTSLESAARRAQKSGGALAAPSDARRILEYVDLLSTKNQGGTSKKAALDKPSLTTALESQSTTLVSNEEESAFLPNAQLHHDRFDPDHPNYISTNYPAIVLGYDLNRVGEYLARYSSDESVGLDLCNPTPEDLDEVRVLVDVIQGVRLRNTEDVVAALRIVLHCCRSEHESQRTIISEFQRPLVAYLRHFLAGAHGSVHSGEPAVRRARKLMRNALGILRADSRGRAAITAVMAEPEGDRDAGLQAIVRVGIGRRHFDS